MRGFSLWLSAIFMVLGATSSQASDRFSFSETLQPGQSKEVYVSFPTPSFADQYCVLLTCPTDQSVSLHEHYEVHFSGPGAKSVIEGLNGKTEGAGFLIDYYYWERTDDFVNGQLYDYDISFCNLCFVSNPIDEFNGLGASVYGPILPTHGIYNYTWSIINGGSEYSNTDQSYNYITAFDFGVITPVDGPVTINVSFVPEPGLWGLMALGAGICGMVLRHDKRRDNQTKLEGGSRRTVDELDTNCVGQAVFFSTQTRDT